MADTFQDFDTMQEFLSSEYYKQALEQFKASKAPKKEWEIVVFKEVLKEGTTFYKLCDDGKYRQDGNMRFLAYEATAFNRKYESIHSVRRLSDGEVFSVGDRIRGFGTPISAIEITDEFSGGLALRFTSPQSGCSIDTARKLPQPILVTHDGVEIFEGDEFWGVRDWRVLEGGKADKYDKNLDKAAPVFSTRSAAEEYILNHKPVLSLNDVREAMPRYISPGEVKAVTDRLTALVKQKLNQ